MGSSPAERAILISPVKVWYVYVLENGEGRRYVGSTGRTPLIRLGEHNADLNRWTRAYGPWRLVYSEALGTKRDALARGRFFKTGAGRRQRDLLVAAAEDENVRNHVG